MSHLTERKEKNCLNCNALVQGRYCQVCGQENIIPQETFRHLVLHFIYDITHFDGKFFETLKYLVFKPGFLSTEHIKGRRVKYLNPVRMYVFTSAIFFLIFFATSSENVVRFTGDDVYTPAERDSMIVELQEEQLKDPADTSLTKMIALLRDTTRDVTLNDLMEAGDGFVILSTIGGNYRNNREYDSLQNAMPVDKRDGWLTRIWNKRAIELKEKYGGDAKNGVKLFTNSLLHKLPYLLFVSLPLFALILKLLYIRHKNILYAGHTIFTIHHYIFSFILLLLIITCNGLLESTGWKFWKVLSTIFVIVWPIHLLIAMHNFYKQGWFKTFGKAILLNLAGFITILLLFIIFVLFAAFQL